MSIVAVVFALLLFAQFVIWLGKPVGPQDAVVLRRSTGDVSGDYQVNIFVFPDWVIGVDPAAGQVKYVKLDSPVAPSRLGLFTESEHIMLDGYMMFDDELLKIKELPGRLGGGAFFGKVTSNFSRWDLFRLWRKLRDNGILYRKSGALAIPEDAVQNEHLSIGVFNGTEITGLAAEAAAWIENVGGNVVEVGNADDTVEDTRIELYVSDGESKATVRRLIDIFGVRPVQVEEGSGRFDIKIVVGKDFVE